MKSRQHLVFQTLHHFLYSDKNMVGLVVAWHDVKKTTLSSVQFLPTEKFKRGNIEHCDCILKEGIDI